MEASNANLERYFAGELLYGDDFNSEQLARWYEGEREGYAGMVLSQTKSYMYGYHELNRTYGFRFLPKDKQLRVLGIGSAYGEEFRPILGQIETLDIVDPSDEFGQIEQIGSTPAHYHKPREDGILPFADSCLDLITAFGVLHHIANVSTVLAECRRVLAPGGILLCREPIVSMGDWRKPRVGLTRNERGIPYELFRQLMTSPEMTILNEQLCDFSPLITLASRFGISAFDNRVMLGIDKLLSELFASNQTYHRQALFKKFAPASAFFAIRKSS